MAEFPRRGGDRADPLHRLRRRRALPPLLHRRARRRDRLARASRRIVALANSWIIINVGGGPTDDKPTVTLETPPDPDRVSSFLNIRVADIQAVYAEWSARGRRVPDAAETARDRDPLLHPRSRRPPDRGRAEDLNRYAAASRAQRLQPGGREDRGRVAGVVGGRRAVPGDRRAGLRSAAAGPGRSAAGARSPRSGSRRRSAPRRRARRRRSTPRPSRSMASSAARLARTASSLASLTRTPAAMKRRGEAGSEADRDAHDRALHVAADRSPRSRASPRARSGVPGAGAPPRPTARPPPPHGAARGQPGNSGGSGRNRSSSRAIAREPWTLRPSMRQRRHGVLREAERLRRMTFERKGTRSIRLTSMSLHSRIVCAAIAG